MSEADEPIDGVALGELLAYLDGERLPHVEQALTHSTALRQRLEELRSAEQGFRRLFGGLGIPAPQDLVDVATGQATPLQQLRVAAYARDSETGAAQLAELLTPEPTPRRRRFLMALPVALLQDVRSAPSLHPTRDQTFTVAEIALHLTLRQIPDADATWRLEGVVSQQGVPLAGVRVTVRNDQAHPRPRMTDSDGFFTLPRLRPGSYQIQLRIDDTLIRLPALLVADA